MTSSESTAIHDLIRRASTRLEPALRESESTLVVRRRAPARRRAAPYPPAHAYPNPSRPATPDRGWSLAIVVIAALVIGVLSGIGAVIAGV